MRETKNENLGFRFSLAYYAVRISRTKIQMSHRPPVTTVRVASTRNLANPYFFFMGCLLNSGVIIPHEIYANAEKKEKPG
jgi:hypothetical protein